MNLSKKELGKFLNNLRISKKLSFYDVNKLCGISPSYLSLMEHGKRRPSAIILKKLAPIYNINYLELYEKAGYIDNLDNKKDLVSLHHTNNSIIPVLKTINSKFDYLSQENIIDYISFKIDGIDEENYFAFNIADNSMEPLFDSGDTVIVHKQTNFKNGENCVVLISDKDAIIRKTYKTNDGIELKSVNPYFPPLLFSDNDINTLKIQIIGIVEKLIRNFKNN